MVSWSELEQQCPDLANLAKERFAATEFVFLGTIRKNGFPRISPVEFAYWEGEFVIGGIWQSKKMLDLLRDPRCVLHSATTNKNGQEGDVKLYGRATPLDPAREPAYWKYILDTMGFDPGGPAHALTVDFESGGYVRFTPEGEMHMLRWPGGEWTVSRP